MAANSEDKDLMGLGQHCSVNTCLQLDFLPLTCRLCSLVFCKDHSSLDAHACAKAGQIQVERVIDDSIPKSYACCLEGCTQKELTQIICDACSQTYCLKHRHQADHKCKHLQKPDERMAQTKQHIEKLQAAKGPVTKKAGQGRKSKATAAKVMLMKIKMKAEGDKGLPAEERVFLQVLFPKSFKTKSKPLFFSNKWTVGRVIDTIARNCGLTNNNNVTGKPKLKLFDSDSGRAFLMADTLGDLASGEEELVSGSTVVLEYVEEDADVLENVDTYCP